MTVLVGNDGQTATLTLGHGSTGQLDLSSFTVAVTGGATNAWLYYSSGVNGSDIYLLAYDTEGNLIAQTGQFTPVAGWNSVPLESPIQLTEGTLVNLGVYFANTGSAAYFGNTSGGSISYQNTAAFSVPQVSSPDGTAYGSDTLSIYLELNPNLPLIYSVGTVQEGASAAIVGSNFAAPMSVSITESNGASIAQSNVTIQSGSITTANVTTQPAGTLTNGTYANVALPDDSSAGSSAVATLVVSQGVATVSITTQPTGTLTNGTYTGVALTDDSSSATGVIATVTVASGSVSAVSITTAGANAAVNDTLYIPEAAITGATGNGVVKVETLTASSITSISFSDPGYGYAVNDTLYIPAASIPGATSDGIATVTAVNSASRATFGSVFESGSDVFAFTDSTYTATLTAAANDIASAPFSVTLAPPAGVPFKTFATPNPNAAIRVAAIPDFVPGDQLEFAGDAAGTTPPPSGTVPHADGSFEASADFYVRAYIAADKAWTPWALITVSPEQPGQGFFGGGGV